MLKCIREKHGRYLQNISDREQLQFIAAAYNCGWYKSTSYIKSQISRSFYTLNIWPEDQKYCFSQIALFRYNELGNDRGT